MSPVIVYRHVSMSIIITVITMTTKMMDYTQTVKAERP